MRHQAIRAALSEDFGITDQAILDSGLSRLQVGEMVKEAIKSRQGRLLFPDSLYDSHYKRNRRSKKRKSIDRLISVAEENGLQLFKYRDFINQADDDSLYSVATVGKAKEHEAAMLGKFPRIGKLERTHGRDGLIHVQGMTALPHGNTYPSDNFQLLTFEDLRSSAATYVGYLLKPGDQNLERDKKGKLLLPFELALIALGDWYIGSLRNHLQGRVKNPQTVWTIGLPRG